MGLGQAMQTMQDLGDLDQLEHLLRNASNPGALAEADMDRVRDLLGDDAARSLERLAELTRMLDRGRADRADARAGWSSRRGACGRSARTPCATCSPSSPRTRSASTRSTGSATGTSARTTPSPTSTATRSSSTCSARSATRSPAARVAGTPVRLEPDDFEIERTEHLTRSSTVLMLDLSMSMPMRDNFLPAKKVAMALHSLISSQFPRDYLGLVGFSETARVLTAEQLPEVTGTSSTAPTCSTASRSPASCSPASPAPSRSS